MLRDDCSQYHVLSVCIVLLYLLTCLKSALIIIVGVSTKNTLLLIVDVIVL